MPQEHQKQTGNGPSPQQPGSSPTTPRTATSTKGMTFEGARLASVPGAIGTKVTVRPGDALSTIIRIRAPGLSVREVADANGLSNPDLILPGQVLWLPGSSVTSAGPTSSIPTTQEARDVAPEPAAVTVPRPVLLEQMAHHLAYEDALSAADQSWLASQRYAAKPVEFGVSGFAMIAFVPFDADLAPVLAFRGTTEDSISDLVADSEAAGIGVYQYYANEGATLQALAALATFGKVELTGHSLGGALAQLTASLLPGLVGHVTTFQSPGIPKRYVELLRKRNDTLRGAGKQEIGSTHHRVEGDLVSSAGEAFTPGEVQAYGASDGGGLGPLAAHGAFPAASAAYGRGASNFVIDDHDSAGLAATSCALTSDSGGMAESLRTGVGLVTTPVQLRHAAYIDAWAVLRDRLIAGESAATLAKETAKWSLSKAQEALLRSNLFAMEKGLAAATSLAETTASMPGTEGTAGEQSAAYAFRTSAATRAGFAWRLLPPAVRDGLDSGAAVMSAAYRAGWVARGGEAGEPDRAITRAEAAQMLANHARWPTSASGPGFAWFADVEKEDWYFAAAQQARRFGVFLGTQQNEFLPDAALGADAAAVVLQRYGTGKLAPLDSKQQTQHLAPEVEQLERPRSAADFRYPGAAASDAKKFGFYAAFTRKAGHGASVPREPGRYVLLGIRGLSLANLATLTVDNSRSADAHNDALVVIGHDDKGTAVVREFPGSTDPGALAANAGGAWGGKIWQMLPGAYEYQRDGTYTDYWGDGNGGGARYRMTAKQQQDGFETFEDSNRNNLLGDAGDTRAVDHGGAFLLHRSSSNADGKVGRNSVGCQVIAGTAADGRLNMDVASELLDKNPAQRFEYVLMDAGAVLSGRST